MKNKIRFSVLHFLAKIIVVVGSSTRTMVQRLRFLRLLKAVGSAGLKLMPFIYSYLDRQNQEMNSGNKVKEKYRAKMKLQRKLQLLDNSPLSLADHNELYTGPSQIGSISKPRLADLFHHLKPENTVLIQYSGGADSTLAGILAARYFEQVHLLTFRNTFTKYNDRSRHNAQKLIGIFGADKIIHIELDSSRALDSLLFESYEQDFKKFGRYLAGVGCLACKSSFDVGCLRYAHSHKLNIIIDGADLSVHSQLSQGNPETMELRNRIFCDSGFTFLHPAAEFERTDLELLNFGLEQDPPVLLYPQQPDCIGNEFLNEIHDRFYFIPRFGLARHTELGSNWLRDKMPTIIALSRKDSSG